MGVIAVAKNRHGIWNAEESAKRQANDAIGFFDVVLLERANLDLHGRALTRVTFPDDMARAWICVGTIA
jgi:hypothetical protein